MKKSMSKVATVLIISEKSPFHSLTWFSIILPVRIFISSLLAMLIKCARSRFDEPSLAFAGVVARPSKSAARFMVDRTLQTR